MLMKPTIVHLPKPKVNHSTKATVITSSPARPSLSTSSSTSSPMATTKTALLSPISSYTQYHGGSNAEQHQMQHSHTIESSKVTINRRHYLVSDTLYFEVPQSIQDNDIIKLLAPCRPITIQRNEYQDQYQNNIATGWIRFIDKEQADRAYTLFDGLVFKNTHRFQLYMTPDGIKDQVPNAPIFQINHLPLSMTNEGLYNLFRPFGPIRLCKIIMEKDASFNGTALLQYFDQQHAENAKKTMNGRHIDGGNEKQISIFSLVSNKLSVSPSMFKSQQPSSKVGQIMKNAAVDYTNLYIKNLDLAAKSADLYNVFRTFGHIISARVMKNPRTKQSRGYGFVSFTRPDDAKTALDQLNGKYILGKPVVIAYHEPKRHTTTTNDNNAASPIVSPAIAITTPPLPITYQQQKSVTEASTLALGNKFTKYGKIDHRHYHAACAATTAVPASSTLKAHMTPQTQNVVSSPPSSSSSSSYYAANKDTGKCGSQRDRVRVAILNIINKNNNIGIDTLDHWVDYIMSLRPTSRALCLFNPAYLEAKLEEKPCLEQDQRTLSQANHHHPGHTPKTPNLVQPSDHHSHASSSTTLSSAAVTTTTSATDIVNMQDLGEQQRHSSIALFVESIKGLSLIQQKQHLGDLLFPYVKATGTKQASKVTIHLLDTQPLEQLAYSMHSMDLLKPLVDKAILTLTRQQNFIKAVMKK